MNTKLNLDTILMYGIPLGILVAAVVLVVVCATEPGLTVKGIGQ